MKVGDETAALALIGRPPCARCSVDLSKDGGESGKKNRWMEY